LAFFFFLSLTQCHVSFSLSELLRLPFAKSSLISYRRTRYEISSFDGISKSCVQKFCEEQTINLFSPFSLHFFFLFSGLGSGVRERKPRALAQNVKSSRRRETSKLLTMFRSKLKLRANEKCALARMRPQKKIP